MPETPIESARPSLTRPERPAEPLVQVMLCIVVAALLLLVIALPMGGPSAREIEQQTTAVELRSTLDALRSAIGEYRYDHGTWPGQVDGELGQVEGELLEVALASRFELQLTQCSDVAGTTAPVRAPSHPLGPYLSGSQLPANPVNGRSSVRILSPQEPWPREPDSSTGWIYRPATGELRANCAGEAAELGVRFADL